MEAAEESERAQHRLLRGILGVRAVPQQPAGEIERGIEMRENEHFEAEFILFVRNVGPLFGDSMAH